MLRHDLNGIVKTANNLGLYTNLSTGGTLLNEKNIQDLYASGLDSLQISFQDSDGSNSENIAGYPKSLDKKKEAALSAKKVGIPLTINVVLHKQNIDHIQSIIELSENMGADRLELANSQFNGWALKNRAWLMPTRSQVERAECVVEEARSRLNDTMQIFYVLPDYFEQFPKPCLYGWGRVFISIAPDGTVLPCQAAREIHGLMFENVRTQSLEKIWFESKSFCMFRGTEWLPEPCRSCPRKTTDFGGCRCQTFLLTGDIAATDPACSLSPHHGIIETAIKEAESTPQEKWSYRNGSYPK